MTATLSIDGIFDGLFDDASQFPPRALSLPDAVRHHEGLRCGSHSSLVGRFLVPADRFPDLASLVPLRAGAIGVVVPDATGPELAAESARACARTTLRVSAVELRLSADENVRDAWRASFPEADLFLEGTAADVPEISDRGALPKIRCGGTAPGAVPTAQSVAAFVQACVDRRVPFKATAGLHQPLSHLDDATGDRQHGFLGLWAATALALQGAAPPAAQAALAAEALDDLDLADLDMQAARQMFLGFGTCSIAEPVDALIALGLLDD